MRSNGSRNKRAKIDSEHLILCEGQDEFNFLIWYLNSEERFAQDARFSTLVQVLDFGGNDELQGYLSLIKNDEMFSEVKSILIVRDAETDAKRAESQIKTSLRNVGLSVPVEPGMWSCESGKPYISYLLFPELGREPQNGTLEHLCMDIIREKYEPDSAFDRVDRFIETLSADGLRNYKHLFKTRIHSFLSVTDPFPGMKIGEAAKSGAFDWNSDRLKGLNDCLLEGFGLEQSEQAG